MKNWQWLIQKTNNLVELFKWLAYKMKNMSFAKSLLLIYLLITIIGSLLLYAPFSQTGYVAWDPITNELKKGNVSFLNALFTSASAFSDTGLSTNTTVVAYNELGQAIIAILIFVGGLGFFALKVFIFNIIFNRPLSFRTSSLLSAERGSVHIGVSGRLIKVAIITLLSIVFVFSIVLSLIFYYTDVSTNTTLIRNQNMEFININNDKLIYENPYYNPLVSIRFGVFHAISALNNAGFDIISNHSLQPYYYILPIQIIFIVLFITGGVGYPVLYDLYRYFYSKKNGEKFRFSLFTKLSTTTYFIVSFLGLIATYLIEQTNEYSFLNNSKAGYGSRSYRFFAIFFNTMSTRNAGFSTVNMYNLSDGTILVYTILMFIGSAPSSTGGGIRTTTLAIIFLTFFSFVRGRKNVYIFGKIIDNSTVKRALVVFIVSVFIVLSGTIVMLTSLDVYGGQIPTVEKVSFLDGKINPNQEYYSYTKLLFEVGSAFGTTGLSTGITSRLSVISKIALILIMLIGQLGVSSSILIWGSGHKKDAKKKALTATTTIG